MPVVERPFDNVRKLGLIFPYAGLAADVCQRALERAITQLNQEEPTGSPWETARTQAVRLTPPSEPSI